MFSSLHNIITGERANKPKFGDRLLLLSFCCLCPRRTHHTTKKPSTTSRRRQAVLLLILQQRRESMLSLLAAAYKAPFTIYLPSSLNFHAFFLYSHPPPTAALTTMATSSNSSRFRQGAGMGSPPSRRPKAGGKGKVSEHDDDAWRKEGGEGGRAQWTLPHSHLFITIICIGFGRGGAGGDSRGV